MRIHAGDMESLIRLVDDLCGLALDDSKAYLAESRLAPLAARLGCADLGQLVRRALLSDGASVREAIVDAMTTHETLFFRDESPFEALQFKALPELLDQQASGMAGRRLRLWSAACSTGQETYSLAIALLEVLGDARGWDVEILGTDVSHAAVEQAQRGEFTDMEVERGLSRERRERWLQRTAGGWRVNDEVRRLTRFAQRNLLEPLPERDYFHVVFCRNVAIYFQRDARQSLFQRLADTMAPTGFLFVGSSENLSDLGPQFSPEFHCRSVFYRPRSAPRCSLSRFARD